MSGTMIDFSSKTFTPSGGVKEKNPIILLHAMLCSKEVWTSIPQAVADSTGRKVHVYDARNHGLSTHTDKSNFSFNVDDLFNFIDGIKKEEKEIEKFILVGHDMGGVTAICAALRKPEDFEKVIVVEMYAKRVPDYLIDRVKGFVSEWTKSIKELPKETPLADVTRMSVEKMYTNLAHQENNEKASYLNGKFLYKETDTGYDSHYNTPVLVEALEQLKSEPVDYQGTYNGPAYFFYGTESHFKIPDEEQSIKKHFPKAVLVPFEKGSHFFVADIPDKLAEEISKRVKQSS